MKTYICLRCSKKSISVEGLRCFHCQDDEAQTVATKNLHLQVPVMVDVSPGYYFPTIDAGDQRTEVDFKPTRETCSRTTDKCFIFLSQTAGRIGYENSTNIYNLFKTERAFHQYTNANQNRISGNSKANYGKFHNQSYDICNPGSSIEAIDDRSVASLEAQLCEKSLIGECRNKYNSDEWLGRQGTVKLTTLVNNVCKFPFTDSITFLSKPPHLNSFSNSSINVEDRQEGIILTSLSSFSQGNPSINECFQEKLVTAKAMAEQKPRTSHMLSKRCEKCKRKFYKESTFHAHLQNNCNSTKPYKCGQCDSKFRSMSRLLEHERVHNGVKPFKCKQCDFASSRSDSLKKHLKTHSSEKSLKCNQCDYASTRSDSLKNHLKTHTKEKPFKCKQCYYASAWSQRFKAHLKTHSSEKPFKCDQCDYASTKSEYLKSHLKKHSSEEPFK